jgi:asparagine synthase (glutamine-hydrolysing)
MCGISGIIHFTDKPVDTRQIETMMELMRHRGPDDEGIFMHGTAGFGHVRLSILDLSAGGHQPMLSNDGRYCLVFNGEIYNYPELKKELRGSYDFKSRSDTEVLLAAWLKWGVGCLHKLNGDFAFTVYDTREKTLFGARDRFGIKPFYYRYSATSFSFASEIKALLPFDDNRSANNKLIFEYLAYSRTDQSHETFFNSIVKLPHGHCFTLRKGELKIKKWYTLSEQLAYPTSLSKEAYREELKASVGLRLRSDVPVGVCLSGGLDSSTITSIVYNDFKAHNLHTFSAVFGQNDRMDESRFIKAYAPLLRNMHYVSPTAASFYNEFRYFIECHTEPTPGISPYAQFKVMQCAQGHVSVTLDGQGADEMLGGYNYFYGSYLKELLTSGHLSVLLAELIACHRTNASAQASKYMAYYLLPPFLKRYFRSRNASISRSFFQEYNRESELSSHLHSPKSLHSFFLQHFEYKLEHLLKYDDLNSMHFSIESRVPFLDHHLVEKTLSLPSSQVMQGGTSKYILRESVKNILPPAIYNRRDKIGFDTPADEWLRSKHFQHFINDLLSSSAFEQRGYLDAKACRPKYKLHLDRKVNISKDIWKWINLEMWFREFIDKKVEQPALKVSPTLIHG